MSNLKIKDSNKSLMTISKKRVSQAIETATTNRLAVSSHLSAPTFLPCVTPEMRKSAIQKYERTLKWEKAKTKRVMDDIIYEHTVPLVETLIDIAITERNPLAINSLLDRGHGSSSKNVNIGGQQDNPIVFLPATLMTKYKIHEGTYVPIPPQE